jgi:hypothetical protein
MILDKERLIDGFRGLPAGMDGSKEPSQTSDTASWYATNVTFRGGSPRTRPGFREISPEFWRNPLSARTTTSIVGDGTTVVVTTSVAHGYSVGDYVTISGASASGFNGTFEITAVNVAGTTFSFLKSTSGTATVQGTCIRDVDYTLGEDLDGDGRNSRARYEEFIYGANYLQGCYIYNDPRDGNPSQIIVVAATGYDGTPTSRILSLNLNDASCYLLSGLDPIDPYLKTYFCQAERYLIIQNGQDEPRVYDGYRLDRASYYGAQVVPVGTQMAYGQGRLFTSVNGGTEIVAGDLAYGGSTASISITSSSVANPTLITTDATHGLVPTDLVTISGHSSVPPINSTYEVLTAPTSTTFTVSAAVTSAGAGGYASKFNAGKDTDLLLLTEHTFLAEGGSFKPPGDMGRITALAFVPVQDTATGQGDLIAFCERGSASFAVAVPRNEWKATQGFQRVLFQGIGSASPEIALVNGDLFFRSKEGNGIRSYRSARADANSYGQTPLSAEISPILDQDTQWQLDEVSFSLFDDRLLMTCLPKQNPRVAGNQTDADTFSGQPVQTIYNGISVLDFRSSATGRGKSSAVFDGVWTGLSVVKLLQGNFDNKPRCYAYCLHSDDTGRKFELWEVTRDDEHDTPIEGKRRINAQIVSKAFNFADPMGLKKLLRCDLWFGDIGGGSDYPFDCTLSYRPDDYPNFITWQSFNRKFTTEFLLESKNILAYTEKIDNASWGKNRVSVIADAINDPLGYLTADLLIEDTSASTTHYVSESVTVVSGSSYTFSVYAKSKERNNLLLQITNGGYTNAIFELTDGGTVTSVSGTGATAMITALDDGWYRCSVSIPSATAGIAYLSIYLASSGSVYYTGDGTSGMYLWGAQMEASPVATSYDPDPPALPNYERGYAPQVRFPTPPYDPNKATSVPAYLGHDFTLRVSWFGRARLGRLMLHGQKIVESVGGGTL